jgi:hypothetical protein
VPAQLAAVERERDALGLGDRDGPQVVAERGDPGAVVAVGGGDRAHLALLHVEHGARVEVDVDDEMLDRPRVRVVGRVALEVEHGLAEPVRALQRVVERAGGEHVDLHERQVVDAARGERRADAFVGEGGRARRRVVLRRDRREGTLDAPPGDHGAVTERHDDLLEPGALAEHDQRLARRRGAAGAPGGELRLARLVQRGADDVRALRPGERGGGRRGELLGAQRAERVRHGHRPPSPGTAPTAIASRQWAVNAAAAREAASDAVPKISARTGGAIGTVASARPSSATPISGSTFTIV